MMRAPASAPGPSDGTAALLRSERLIVDYRATAGFWGHKRLRAVNEVSLEIHPGKILGLVGESGCGKSSLARVLGGLQRPSGGSVSHAGADVWSMSSRARRTSLGRDIAMVFQDPGSSLNPRWRVRRIVKDPLDIHKIGSESSRVLRVNELLDLVGLPSTARDMLPRQLSGGQRQRVAIARALAVGPRLLIADEPTSALDVSVKSQVLNLLAELRQRLSLSMVLISHDIHAVRYLADRIAVMYLGDIIEEGPADAIYQRPSHPYTKALLSAVPMLSGEHRNRIVLAGGVPSALDRAPGCSFRPRCWRATPECDNGLPPGIGVGRMVRCLHPLEDIGGPQ